jgi:antitoxin HicB
VDLVANGGVTVDVAAEVARYMALPYRIELIPGETAWVVSIPDLPGCLSQGRTPEDALERIKEAQELWIEGAIRDGLPIPTPSASGEKEYSGRLLIRIPADMHRDLARVAEEQRVSINLYVATALARAVGRPPTVAGQAQALGHY